MFILATAMLALLQSIPYKSERSGLVSRVVNIAERSFLPNQTLLISSAGLDADTFGFLLGKINDRAMWAVQVARTDITPVGTTNEDHYKIGGYIILVRDCTDLEEQREELMSRIAWSNEARFLVIVAKRVADPASLALSIVQELWKIARVLQVVVMVETQLYTWFPYEQCSTSKRIVQVDDMEPLFPDKTLSRRHGCQLTVGTTPVMPHVKQLSNNSFWGLEIEYLRLLQHALNFTVTYRTPGPGNSHDRHFELVQELHVGMSDVILGDFPLHLYLMQLADPTVPYLDSSLKWFVPCARQASRMKTVMRIYTTSVWATMVLVMLLASGFTWWWSRHSQHPRSFLRVLQDVWALTFGVSVKQLPRDFGLRVLFALLLWYFIALSTIFQTLFTSVLVDPGLHKQITTFEEVQQSGLKYCTFADIERYINASGPYLTDIKLQKVQNIDLLNCIRRVLQSGDMVTVNFAYLIEYVALTDLGTRNSICSLNENVFQMSYTMYVTKGSPLLSKFNRIIRSMLEAGVMQKLWLDIKEEVSHIGLRETYSAEQFIVMSLSHLKLAFCLLVMGHAMSCIVFLVELVIRRLALRATS
jgi:hypothetical protein